MGKIKITEIAWLIFLVSILILSSLYIYKLFYPDKSDNSIRLEITGVREAVNATTVTSLHAKCIEFCAERFSSSYLSAMRSCWEECAKLGQEVICGGKK